MPSTLQELRQEIGRDLHELHLGTISAPSPTGFTDEALIDFHGSGDTKIEGAWVRVNGMVRRVDSYRDDIGQVTLTRNWTAPSAGTRYELHTLINPEELDRFINRALAKCQYVTYEYLDGTAGTRQYILDYPWLTRPKQIRGVFVRTGDYGEYTYTPIPNWVVRVEDDQYGLLLTITDDVAAGETIVLEIVRAYAPLDSDSEETTCPPDWVRAGAEVEIYRYLSRHDPSDEANRMRAHEAQAALRYWELTRRYSPRPAPRVRFP